MFKFFIFLLKTAYKHNISNDTSTLFGYMRIIFFQTSVLLSHLVSVF